MKLFLIGATGRTGTHVIYLGLARGHQVTAFVRSPEKITRQATGLKVVKGNPMDAAEMAKALPGHDAVITALGAVPSEVLKPHTLMRDAAAATVSAMQQARVRRLLILSASLLFPSKNLFYILGRFVLRENNKDLQAAEKIYQESGLDWTIARPPRLVQNPNESYQSFENTVPKGFQISWKAVAAFFLDAAEKGEYVGKVVGISQ